MKRMTEYLYVISLDGLSTLDFEYITSLPNFKNFIKEASYCKKVYSVYPTLTYPAHATIVTGKYPKETRCCISPLYGFGYYEALSWILF